MVSFYHCVTFERGSILVPIEIKGALKQELAGYIINENRPKNQKNV